jgi:hypothetical protein
MPTAWLIGHPLDLIGILDNGMNCRRHLWRRISIPTVKSKAGNSLNVVVATASRGERGQRPAVEPAPSAQLRRHRATFYVRGDRFIALMLGFAHEASKLLYIQRLVQVSPRRMCVFSSTQKSWRVIAGLLAHRRARILLCAHQSG